MSKFYLADELFLQQLVSRISESIRVSNDPEDLQQAKVNNARHVQKFRNRLGVCTQVEAIDDDAAKNLASKQIRLSVDVLNFYANLGGQPLSQVLLNNDAPSKVINTFLFSEELGQLSYPSERMGPLGSFSFAAAYTKNAGFVRASEMLGKRSRFPIEDRIISALRWAGRASVEVRTETAFLLFAMSLESLLMDRDSKSEITETLALRTARLAGANPSGRHKIYKDVKKLYGIRSNIVHNGSVEVGEDELSLIRFVARIALLTMVCNRPFTTIHTEDDLRNWFKDRLLA